MSVIPAAPSGALPLFEFIFRPLDQVVPWGTAPDLMLSWFGLTDGDYRINAGSERLFAYSETAINRFSAKYPGFRGDFVDYQVVRLWEDICEILPDVLAPIPQQFAAGLSDANLSFVQWVDNASRWWESLDDAALEAEWDNYGQAIAWLGRRKLDSLYLQAGPRIWFWSTEESVTITWQNTGLELEGVEAWAARAGRFSISRDAFLSEVHGFNDRLIEQMARRVETVCTPWNRPEVRIDFEALRSEQAERALFLRKTLALTPHGEDWAEARRAVAAVTQKMAASAVRILPS